MNKIKEKALTQIAKAANKLAEREFIKIPPTCIAVLYQPQRPMKTTQQTEDETAK